MKKLKYFKLFHKLRVRINFFVNKHKLNKYMHTKISIGQQLFILIVSTIGAFIGTDFNQNEFLLVYFHNLSIGMGTSFFSFIVSEFFVSKWCYKYYNNELIKKIDRKNSVYFLGLIISFFWFYLLGIYNIWGIDIIFKITYVLFTIIMFFLSFVAINWIGRYKNIYSNCILEHRGDVD